MRSFIGGPWQCVACLVVLIASLSLYAYARIELSSLSSGYQLLRGISILVALAALAGFNHYRDN